MNIETLVIKPEILSGISRDIAQVFFAAMVVESIVNGSYNYPLIFFGTFLSLSFWSISLLTDIE